MAKKDQKGLLFSEETARNITDAAKGAAKEAAALTAILVVLMLAGVYGMHKKIEEAKTAQAMHTKQN